MLRLVAVIGVVFALTTLFLFLKIGDLNKEILILNQELKRANKIEEQLRKGLSDVSIIKNNNNSSSIDIVDRLRKKGYLRD